MRARTHQQHEIAITRRTPHAPTVGALVVDLPGQAVAPDDLNDPGSQRLRLATAPQIFRLEIGFAQRIAQTFPFWNLVFPGMIEKRKQFDAPRQGTAQRSLFAERRERGNTEEQRVHDVDDRLCITPRHVLLATHSAELVREEIGGNAEQARFGATKTIDRLLGVADHEDARPRRVRIGIEPRTQNLPLQGIGVLELVQQHMLVTRIETGLQERCRFFVAQQFEHLPLRVDKIDLPPRLFE